MQVCTACSTRTAETGRFCPACGAVLAAAPVGLTGSKTSVLGSPPHLLDDVEAAAAASASKSAQSLVGTQFDGFAIEGILGSGSFGTVYRGRQLGLERVVAIKVPTHEIAADPVMAKRFAREARSASRIVHPGVVAIHGVGELADGRPYMAMQFVEGEPLDKILDGGPLPPIRALGIARQIASALSETHAAEVVHRDLKPSNIVWRRDRNGDDRITIVDFGIAVAKPGNADATRLTAGGLIGTPHYMSPEQAHGEVVDARADLYALGCLLFELLTATTPYDGSAFEVLLAHLGRPAPLPSTRVPGLPSSIDNLVGKLMAKRPDERVQTADTAVAMIDEVLDQLEGVRPPVLPSSEVSTKRSTAKQRARRKTGAPTERDRPALLRAESPIPTAPFDPELAPPPPSSKPALPTQQLRRPSPARWMALGAAGMLAVGIAVLVAIRLVGDPAVASSLERGRPTERDPGARREIVSEAGDMRLRVWVPDPMRAGPRMQWLRFELRTKLGETVAPETVVVTVTDPRNKQTGITARPRQQDPAQLGFGHVFDTPGTYLVRIFPPDTASAFDIALEVAP